MWTPSRIAILILFLVVTVFACIIALQVRDGPLTGAAKKELVFLLKNFIDPSLVQHVETATHNGDLQ
ncbi:CUN070 hypothetical protein [Culex nigripalpus nucleopolyhedrovirus]|uniref:Uncharacterized protein n=1 Tax=Culex nigripalpus nucleopolyhedrovirus (isolate Florida/1997) TaxID=645993 RepID=Q919K6_NPVCO|nr:CUN070 hypothetical protein [Culex nigripalpus nucleopolyhedrovirus]AAK94148.1 CUN070 hypothetical protein [Culex nigripalpus nucleopolyhedrovirus]